MVYNKKAIFKGIFLQKNLPQDTGRITNKTSNFNITRNKKRRKSIEGNIV